MKVRYLYSSFKNKQIPIDLRDVEELVKEFQLINFSLRELERLVNKSILNGPLTRVEKADHFIHNPIRDNYVLCECKSSKCCGVKMSHLSIPPEKVVIPEVRFVDLKEAASAIVPLNEEDLIIENKRFSEGLPPICKDVTTEATEDVKLTRVRSNSEVCACCLFMIVILTLVFIVLFAEIFMQ